MPQYDVAIIGGGLSGLSSAYFLSKEGFSVILLEKEKDLGGLCGSYDLGEYSIEKFYHHAIAPCRTLLNILDELKIKNLLEWKRASLGFYLNGKVHAANNLIDMALFPLSLPDKMKMASLILKIKLTGDVSALDGVRAKDWIIKHGGNGLYEKFFLPLLKGKYGDIFEEASAAWFLERIRLRSTRSLGGEKLGYMKHGFKILVDKLKDNIVKNGGQIHTDTLVKKIEINPDGFTTLIQNDNFKSKNVIFTANTKDLLKFCNLPNDYSENLKKMNYQGTICALFGLKEQLQSEYWLNFISENLPFAALIEHTNFHNIREYGDTHIVYIPIYIQNQNNALWNMKDEQIINMLIAGLTKAFPTFDKNDIRWWKIERSKYTAPVYNLGYMSNLPKIETPLKGFYIGGLALSYPERTMNSALAVGKQCVKKIAERSD